MQSMLHVARLIGNPSPPRDVHTFSGLAQAFFGLAAMPLAFERICSQSQVWGNPDITDYITGNTTGVTAIQTDPQPPVVGPLVAAALPLVGCGFDLARKTVSS